MNFQPLYGSRLERNKFGIGFYGLLFVILFYNFNDKIKQTFNAIIYMKIDNKLFINFKVCLFRDHIKHFLINGLIYCLISHSLINFMPSNHFLILYWDTINLEFSSHEFKKKWIMKLFYLLRFLSRQYKVF
jgi:hypothetical protein